MLDNLDSQLNLLELKCRWPVEHLLSGEYRSVFKGKGIEFEDVRIYEAGDDVRSMDWKVTARTGTPHIKRFIEEREQFIYLLVDVSGSILHDNKGLIRQTVVEICSLLTIAAIKNQDRVGLILFTDRIEHIIPPKKGRSHALRVMDTLMNFQPQGRQTDIVQVLQKFNHLAPRRSVAFIVSDFFTQDYVIELQSSAYKHDVTAICIHKGIKEDLAKALVRMEDSESREQKIIDLAYRDPSREFTAETFKQDLMETGVGAIYLEAGDDCVEALTVYFRQRQQLSLNDTGG
ncbi:MAG: DUF58 domain-containing protein [Verrucomicrobiota bacterium]